MRPDAVQIIFTSGYGAAAASVPPSLAMAIKFMAAHWYDQRAIITETRSVEVIPHTFDALLAEYRVRALLG